MVSEEDVERTRQAIQERERMMASIFSEHRRLFELLGQPVKDERTQVSTVPSGS